MWRAKLPSFDEATSPLRFTVFSPSVTGHDLFPRSSQIIFQPHSQIPIGSDWPTVVTERATAG